MINITLLIILVCLIVVLICINCQATSVSGSIERLEDSTSSTTPTKKPPKSPAPSKRPPLEIPMVSWTDATSGKYDRIFKKGNVALGFEPETFKPMFMYKVDDNISAIFLDGKTVGCWNGTLNEPCTTRTTSAGVDKFY